MATSNVINANGAGIAKYDGAGTWSVTTTTQHDVLIGGTSNAIVNVAPSATSGVPLISQGAAADPTFGTAVVAGGGTGSVTFNINGAVFSNTTTTGVLQAATLTAGQILIGSATTPAAATITPSTGISIANGNNSITISATTGILTWVDVTGATQTLAAQTGYVTDHTNVTYTLPASGTLGDTIKIVGKLGIATVAQNANQQILFGSSSSTVGVGGNIVATNVGDCVELICITAGASTVWRVDSAVGNWTIT